MTWETEGEVARFAAVISEDVQLAWLGTIDSVTIRAVNE